jgi:hypothetical protein
VAYFSKLFNSISGLQVWVVASSDCSHWGRLIPCVWLSRVLKVRVRATRTVDADIASGSNVRTTMWFAHDSNNSNSTGSSDWLCFEQRY